MRFVKHEKLSAVIVTGAVYAVLIFAYTAFHNFAIGSIVHLCETFCPVKGGYYNNIPIYRDNNGYDGIYYYRLALDPSSKNPSIPIKFDMSSYRQQRILFPLIVRFFSFGHTNAIPYVTVAINLISLLLISFFTALFAQSIGRSPFRWGVLTAFYPGFVFSLFYGLPEPFMGFLIVFALWAIRRQHFWVGCIALIGAILTRETSALIVFSVGAAILYSKVKNSKTLITTPLGRPYAGLLLLTIIPLSVLAVWQFHLFHSCGTFPFLSGSCNFCLPLMGLYKKILPTFLSGKISYGYEWLLILGFFVSGWLAVTTIIAKKIDRFLVFPFIVYASIMLFYSYFIWEYRGGYLRALTEYYLFGTMILMQSDNKLIRRAHGFMWSVFFIISAVGYTLSQN